jgi:hypothetical protein
MTADDVSRALRLVAAGSTVEAAAAYVAARVGCDARRLATVARMTLDATGGCRECGGEGVCEPAGWGHDPAWPREVPCPGCRPREHAAAEMARDGGAL